MHSVWSWLVITGKCGEVNVCRTETYEGGLRNKHGHKTTSLSLMASQILMMSFRYPPRCPSIFSSTIFSAYSRPEDCCGSGVCCSVVQLGLHFLAVFLCSIREENDDEYLKKSPDPSSADNKCHREAAETTSEPM